MYTARISLMGTVEKGGYLKADQEIQAEAVQKIHKVVPAGSTDLEIDVAPVTKAGIQFFMITASAYDPADLSYKVNADATVFLLTTPHVYVGEGQAALLPADPANIKVTNNTGADITIEILVLWNTTI